jgi:predicted DCC family thiol-disulfide oxidoreductase YuxK
MPKEANKILLFDGVCNLCNTSVLFVIKRDKHHLIRYTSLQSNKGKLLLKKYNIVDSYLGSLIFIDNQKVYLKSTGALRLCKYLNGMWPLLYALILVPPFIRNAFYDIVAKYRYQWFGKNEVCMVPTAELKSLFINDEDES